MHTFYMRVLIGSIVACCWCFLLLVLHVPVPVVVIQQRSGNDGSLPELMSMSMSESEYEYRSRRRLTFFDPASVEYKDGELLLKPTPKATPKAKNSTRTTKAKKNRKKKSTRLFQEGKNEDKQSKEDTEVTATATPNNPQHPLTQSKENQEQNQPAPATPSTTEPSHIKLCRELIHRTEGAGSKKDNFVVYENPARCASSKSFASLSFIMLSAAIAQAGSKARLVYHHNCTSDQPTTIQQWLPQDLTFGVGIGQEQMQDKCTKCIKSEHFTQCMGVPIAGTMTEPLDPMTASLRIAAFRHNIQQAVQDIRKSALSQVRTSPTYGGAVIVLDLEMETSGKAWALPLFFYQDIIHKNVSSIAILTTHRCIAKSPNCKHHSQLLTKELTTLYPSAQVHAEVLSLTSIAYARIMEAPQLICPPTVFCILPSLFNEYSKASYHVMNPNLYEWFKYIARENRKLMGKQIVIFERDDVKPKDLSVSDEDLETFLHSKRPKVRRRRLTMMGDPKTVVNKYEQQRLLTPVPGLYDVARVAPAAGNAFAGYSLGEQHRGAPAAAAGNDVAEYTLDSTIPSYPASGNDVARVAPAAGNAFAGYSLGEQHRGAPAAVGNDVAEYTLDSTIPSYPAAGNDVAEYTLDSTIASYPASGIDVARVPPAAGNVFAGYSLGEHRGAPAAAGNDVAEYTLDSTIASYPASGNDVARVPPAAGNVFAGYSLGEQHRGAPAAAGNDVAEYTLDSTIPSHPAAGNDVAEYTLDSTTPSYPAAENDVAEYTLDSTIPSYVHLCRELLDRKQHMRLATQYLVHESSEVCNSPDSFQSLTTMMISSIVAHAGSLLRISYQHKCSPPEYIKTATIQQLLPAHLSIAKGIGMDAVLDRCSACATQPRDAKSVIECFGFPVPGPMASDPVGAIRMIPPFRHNIEAAVNKVRVLEAGDRPPTNAGVVIYLDTDTEMGTDVYQVPMKYYAEIIPRDISTISIVVSERCATCDDLSAFTKEYLHMMYPTAKIEIELVSGSAIAYARVMEAPFNICSPSMFCLLPSLFKEFSHKSHIIMHPHLYPWYKFLASETGERLNKSIFLRDDLAVRPVVALNDMKAFLFEQAEPLSAACVDLRGRLGEWTQDLEYGKFAQYVTPLKRFQKFDFTPTSEMPYRLATTYRWVDALCPIYVTENDRLCSAMNSRGLTRIYIVGDSLGMQMAQSLWKLLGNEDDPYFTKADRFHWSRTVDCPNHPHGIEVAYTRNDLLDNNDEKDLHLRIGDRDFNCGYAEFCLPWIRNFADFPTGGTLLVANVGAHVHDMDLYRQYLDDFFALMDGYNTPKDVVMFRTTVPGHENCQDPNVAPLRNYDEYLEKHFISDFKSYQLFSTYNRMAEERVRARNGIQILDVVPMTILRPDGHTSGPQKCATCKNDDCLHYMLPGPTDWWNHLMYSNLINLAAAAKNPETGGSKVQR